MKLSELKPCPFCGSTDLDIEVEDEYFNGIFVSCNGCTADGPFVDVDIAENGVTDADRQKAADLWNRRKS